MASDDDLRARFRELEDRLAIVELEGAYCRRFDERDGEGWAQLFTEHGRYRYRGMTKSTDLSYYEGRNALAALFCNNPPFIGIHLAHMPQVEIDGDTAKGRVHFEFVGSFVDPVGGTLSRAVGFYDVLYERVGGKWLFADKVTTTFSVDGKLAEGYPVGWEAVSNAPI